MSGLRGLINMVLVYSLLISLAPIDRRADSGSDALHLSADSSEATALEWLHNDRFFWDEEPWFSSDIQGFLEAQDSPLHTHLWSTAQGVESAGELISAAAIRYGIDAKAFLAFLELYGIPVAGDGASPPGDTTGVEPNWKSPEIESQLHELAESLKDEYVLFSVEGVNSAPVLLGDGTIIEAGSFGNAATYSLARSLAQAFDYVGWQRMVLADAYATTYESFFQKNPHSYIADLGGPTGSPFLSTPFDGSYDQNIYSLFDHEWPNYDGGSTIVVSNGERRNGSSLSCTGFFSCYSGHDGYDYPMSPGTQVRAAAGGRVIYARLSTECGDPNTRGVIIDHQNGGYYTNYWHLSSFSVSEGDTVGAGQLLGQSGNSGCSTGPHLHFNVRLNNLDIDPFDWTGGYTEPCVQNGTCRAAEWLWINSNCGDDQPPDGDYLEDYPEEGGVYNSSVDMKAWARDQGCDPSGVDRADFRAYYSGNWHTVGSDGQDCSGGSTCSHYDDTWSLGGVPDGEITMGLDLRDKDGNWAYTPRGTFPIYKGEPPTISFNHANSINVTENSQDIHSSNPNWSFDGTASDDDQVVRVEYWAWGNNGSGPHTANGTTNWTYQRNGLVGHNRVHFNAYDNNGFRNRDSDRHYIDLFVDTANSQTSSELGGTQGNNGWFRSNITVSLHANDQGSGSSGQTNGIPNHYSAGIDYIRYRIDGGGWQTVNGANKTFTVSGDGNHTVNYYAVDNVGNTESQKTVTFKIDATPPSIPSGAVETHGVQSNQWQRDVDDANFTWNPASDNLSGVAGYQLYWGDQPNGTGVTWRSDPAFDPGPVATGTYYLRGRTQDNAGNYSAWVTLFIFRYDGTPPQNPNVTHDAGIFSGIWQNTSRSAGFSWETPIDIGSGVAGYFYYWGPSEDGTSGNYTTANEFTDPTPICDLVDTCTWYFRIQTKDNAGNTADWATAFVLRYDNAPPVGTLTANYGLTQTAQTIIRLDIDAFDLGSGVQTMRLSNEGTSWTDWLPYETPIYWEIPYVGRRSYDILLQLADAVPNTSEIISDTVFLDVNPPQPKSENFRLWDDSWASGGTHSDSPIYELRSSVGQWHDSPISTSPSYLIWSGYEAGALAEPTVIPPYERLYGQVGQVIAGGGTPGGGLVSANFRIGGTLGQPAHVRTTTSDNFILFSGYWGGAGTLYEPPPPPPPDPPGPPVCEFFKLTVDEDALYTYERTVTLSLCGPDAEEVRVSNDGDFSSSPWQPFTTEMSWLLEGSDPSTQSRIVFAEFRDANGQVHGVFQDDIIFDPNAPAGTIAVPPVPGGESIPGFKLEGVDPWRQVVVVNDHVVELNIDAIDDSSGVWEMQLSEDPSFAGAEWEPYNSFRPWTTSAGDGQKTIYVRFRDRATNDSATASDIFVVDTTGPVGTMTPDDPVIGLGAITVPLTVEADDELGNVEQMRLSYSPSFDDTVWVPYATTATIPFEFDDAQLPVVYVQFQDSFLNDSDVYSTTYFVDITPPSGIAEVEFDSSPERTVNLTAWDYQSGVVEMWLSPDYFFQENVEVLPYTDSFTWDFSDTPVVYVMLIDGVGNFSDRISAVLYNPTPTDLFLPVMFKP